MAVKLGLVGVGKIARAAHLPAIAANADFALLAAASRNTELEGVRHFRSLAAMLAAMPEIEAVSLCTPPAARTGDALAAIAAGKHVMLEKPPAATISEIKQISAAAAEAGVSLFATWHSRCALGVEPARAWLKGRAIRRVTVNWREDVRVWHPGQDWIFEAGGFGVFDPGVNALSILTHILPSPFALRAARLEIPANRQAPIAATLHFALGEAPIEAHFDFLQTGPQTWEIIIETDAGRLALQQGGATAAVDGRSLLVGADDSEHGEYVRLYRRFAALIAGKQSDVDIAPLVHVADAFMRGERAAAPAFDW